MLLSARTAAAAAATVVVVGVNCESGSFALHFKLAAV